MRVLLLIPELAWSGAAKQLSLLARGLPRDRFDVRVVVLGRDGPAGDALRAAGLDVQVLGWTRLIDARPIWRLRRLAGAFQPDVVHGWGWPALRAGLTLSDQPRLLVHSGLLPRDAGTKVNPLNRWLLQRTDRVVAPNQAEAGTYRELGVLPEKIALIPPGVVIAEADRTDPHAFRAARGLPERARLLIGVGRLEPSKGFRHAIWAFDILKYLYEDLHLVLIGDGSDLARLEDFARAINVRDRVHLVGGQPDVAPWLAHAEVVWVPSLADTGANVALEAMAAARPVVASRRPGSAEIVVDGETGYLTPPGDSVALARQTRFLLDDADRRRQLGDAGRRRAAGRFAATDMVRRHIDLYDSRHDRGTQA